MTRSNHFSLIWFGLCVWLVHDFWNNNLATSSIGKQQCSMKPQEISLDTLFSCEILRQSLTRDRKSPPTLNFFSSAAGEKYEDLLPLYSFTALNVHHSLGGVIAELVVPNRKRFVQRNLIVLDWLRKKFSSDGTTDPFCVREYSANHLNRTNFRNTWRFLEVPVIQAKYTYIGDVDIFFTESVLDPMRLQQMKEFNIPYSNIVRDYNVRAPRLTGLMLLKTQEFYTHAFLRAQQTLDVGGNDEVVLYKLVKEAALGTPPRNSSSPLLSYRPTHGIHFSFNRGPGKKLCSGSRPEFDEIFSTNAMKDYLAVDANANRFASDLLVKITTQEKGNYTLINGSCRLGYDNTTPNTK